MSFALVAHTGKAGSSGGVTSDAIDTTGANLIVIALTAADLHLVTPTDSKSNTWTPLTIQSPINIESQFFYCVNPTVGSGHTFAMTNGSSFPAITITAWSGGKITLPFDQQNGANAGSGFSLAPGSVTPTENNELVITAFGNENGGTVTPPGGAFTLSDSIPPGGSNHGNSQAYSIQTSAAAANPTWTSNASGPMAALIATFKSEPAAAVGLPFITTIGAKRI